MSRPMFQIVLDLKGRTHSISAASGESLIRHYLRAVFGEAYVQQRLPRLRRAKEAASTAELLSAVTDISSENQIRIVSGEDLLKGADGVFAKVGEKALRLAVNAVEWAEEEYGLERAWRWSSRSIHVLEAEPDVAFHDGVHTDTLIQQLPETPIRLCLSILNQTNTGHYGVTKPGKAGILKLWETLKLRLDKSPQEVALWAQSGYGGESHKQNQRLQLWDKDTPGRVYRDAAAYLHLATLAAPHHPEAILYNRRVSTADVEAASRFADALTEKVRNWQRDPDGSVSYRTPSSFGKVVFGPAGPTELLAIADRGGSVLAMVKVGEEWRISFARVGIPSVPVVCQQTPPWSANVPSIEDLLVYLVRCEDLHWPDSETVTHSFPNGVTSRLSIDKYDALRRQWNDGVVGKQQALDPDHPLRTISTVDRHKATVLCGLLLGDTPPTFGRQADSETHVPVLQWSSSRAFFRAETPTPNDFNGGDVVYELLLSGRNEGLSRYLSSNVQDPVTRICNRLQGYDLSPPQDVASLKILAARYEVAFRITKYTAESRKSPQPAPDEEITTSLKNYYGTRRLVAALRTFWNRAPGSHHYHRFDNGWRVAAGATGAERQYRVAKGTMSAILLMEGNAVTHTTTTNIPLELREELCVTLEAYVGGARTYSTSLEKEMQSEARSELHEALSLLTPGTYQKGGALLQVSQGRGSLELALTLHNTHVPRTSAQTYKVFGDTLCDNHSAESVAQLENVLRGPQLLEAVHIPNGVALSDYANQLRVNYAFAPSATDEEGFHSGKAGHRMHVYLKDGVPHLLWKSEDGSVLSTDLTGENVRHSVLNAYLAAVEDSGLSWIRVPSFNRAYVHVSRAELTQQQHEALNGWWIRLPLSLNGYIPVRAAKGVQLLHIQASADDRWYHSLTFDTGADKITLLRDKVTGRWSWMAGGIWPLSGVSAVELFELLDNALAQKGSPSSAYPRTVDKALLAYPDVMATPSEKLEQGKQEEAGGSASEATNNAPPAVPPAAEVTEQAPSGDGASMKEHHNMDKKAEPQASATTATERAKALAAAAANEAKANAQEAAWRTAANQMVKLTRDPLAGLLQRHLGPNDESMRKKIADFLMTEAGTALLAGVLATGIMTLPGMSEKASELARQLRIKAMADMGDLAMDVLMGPLRQVMAAYLQGDLPELPAPPQLGPATPLEEQLHGVDRTIVHAE